MTTSLPAGLVPHREIVAAYDPAIAMQRSLRTVHIAIVTLVFGLGGLAAFVPIGGAVIGSGQVGVESRVKRVAHAEGGIVADVRVHNGQHVRKGDILMRLSDVVSSADAELSTLSVDQLLAQRARLEAERLGSPAILWPTELTARKDEGAKRAISDEARLFEVRRQEQQGMVSQLQARIRQYGEEATGYQVQIGAYQQQARLIAPEREGVLSLYKRGLVTVSRKNELERTAINLDGSIGALRANIAQSQARIAEAREQVIQLGMSRRSEAGVQLGQVNSVLNQQRLRSVSAGDARTRSLIRASYDGVVDKLAFNTPGDVIRPAETIMEIVPDRDRLIVEAMVNPADIDRVRVAQRARVRFTALDATTTPEIAGRLVFVAPDRTTDAQSQRSWFAVKMEVDAQALGKGVVLKPGMPAEIFIETGSRTLLSYVTKPLRDQLARAFRD